jgi:hypothetical protein
MPPIAFARFRRPAAALVLAGASALASAAAGSGPFAVWVDFAPAPARAAIDDAVGQVWDAAENACWSADALLYVHKRPPEMSDELLHAALLEHDTGAQRIATALMRVPFDDAPRFDAVIGYVEDGDGPRLLGMSSFGTIKIAPLPPKPDAKAWRQALCDVLPAR